jgi:signal transduction histidine kinase
MFKRFRRLQISLAAKCQLLFGAAVLLIITAALYVPWQRMEQLMEQINERTARTLAEWAEADHLARKMAEQPTRPGADTEPARIAARSTQPATAPTSAPVTGAGGVREKAIVRLVLLKDQGRRDLTRFEQRAVKEFEQDPAAEPMYRRQDNKEGPTSFKYARALYAWPRCVTCHQDDVLEETVAKPRVSASDPKPGAPDADPKPSVLGMVSIEIPYQVEANQVFLNRIFIALAGLLAGTLAIVVFYLITTRLILSPVRILQEIAEKVSEGDLNIRSDISTGDEFQVLSETFNRMLVNLKEGEDQLRALNKGLDMKVADLAESNLALYESNRLKSEFLANVSHELRTPLNSILGFAELLRDLHSTDPKSLRFLQNITASGTNLLNLINDLLDLAKIEAGRMEVRSEPLSLPDLFEGLTGILKPLAEKKSVTIAARVAGDVPIVQTDGGKLQQVLYNFLSNAIKFSPEGGKIDVRAERLTDEQARAAGANGNGTAGDYVRIAVTDQGPGIEPEKQALIFEKFRQIDGSVTRTHGGTGLGLSISRELVQLLGGSIGVHSRPGEGASFWIVLPLKIEPRAQALGVMVANH